MDLLEELKRTKEQPKRPSKTAVSAYLEDQQIERLDSLAAQCGGAEPWSHSKTIGRLVDFVFEQMQARKRGGV